MPHPAQEKWIIRTERLLLRELDVADAKDFFDLNNDPEVVKFTGDRPFGSIAAAEAFLAGYDHYHRFGYGRWGVISAESSEFLGWCGLRHTSERNETDLGFRFHRKHWCKGYATEAAKACLSFAFENLNLPYVAGRAVKANSASIRVLEKCGFIYWKDLELHGMDGICYRVETHT